VVQARLHLSEELEVQALRIMMVEVVTIFIS